MTTLCRRRVASSAAVIDGLGLNSQTGGAPAMPHRRRAVKARPRTIIHTTVFNNGAFPTAYEGRAFSGGRSMAARTTGMPRNARSTSK